MLASSGDIISQAQHGVELYYTNITATQCSRSHENNRMPWLEQKDTQLGYIISTNTKHFPKRRSPWWQPASRRVVLMGKRPLGDLQGDGASTWRRQVATEDKQLGTERLEIAVFGVCLCLNNIESCTVKARVILVTKNFLTLQLCRSTAGFISRATPGKSKKSYILFVWLSTSDQNNCQPE